MFSPSDTHGDLLPPDAILPSDVVSPWFMPGGGLLPRK
jgi:hypothetical protein